ncbi:MAG TPA: 2OG-Fe(II) oxygenase [Steroidobacteraceae bacterium]
MNQPAKLIDARTIAFLRQWMQVGGDMSVPVLELLKRGCTESEVVGALEEIRPKGNALAGGAMNQPPLLRRAPPQLRRIESAGFPLYVLDDFLTAEQCAGLIEIAAARLRPSPLTRAHYDAEFRTSTTANLFEIDDPRAREVDDLICRTIGIRAAYSEGIQIQRYEAGQQFKPHLDCFEPGSQTYQRFAGMRGNRTWTFMVYLNEGMEGGATRFPVVDVAVQPRMGMALLWNNLHEDGSPDKNTLHCGEPVTQGFKVIITKWFRVHGDGPVLHE